MLKWQHRIWLCLTEFNKIRLDEKISISSDEKFKEAENRLFQSTNLELCHATENFKNSQFGLAIKVLQSISDELRVRQVSEFSQLFKLKNSTNPYREHPKMSWNTAPSTKNHWQISLLCWLQLRRISLLNYGRNFWRCRIVVNRKRPMILAGNGPRMFWNSRGQRLAKTNIGWILG